VVDGGEPGVDSRDEGKHTGRNDLLLCNGVYDNKSMYTPTPVCARLFDDTTTTPVNQRISRN